MPDVTIHHGDCRDVLAAMDAESGDAIVTDPPYGLGFMGVKWDTYGDGKGRAPSGKATFDQVGGNSHARKPGGVELIRGKENRRFQQAAEGWFTACLRVAKPGAHLAAFGGTRTYHRLACAIEDAGWEIRDCLMWLYGSGFPKSLNLRDEWSGWGTALKPAWEPIILARKPLAGTVAANVQDHGTGALNIDGCRIEAEGGSPAAQRRGGTCPTRPGEYARPLTDRTSPERYAEARAGEALGRWPANVVLDEDAAALLDEQAGVRTSGAWNGQPGGGTGDGGAAVYGRRGTVPQYREAETGGASRFFYTAKASRGERTDGNTHPTVKPLALMRWLVRLVTPPRGLVLDPFCGSGTTGVACVWEGVRFVGIERDATYVEIARGRLREQGGLFAMEVSA